MGRLCLAFLGGPEIRHAGRPITLATRKALALLAYLAVEGGTHSREKLTAIFWPESNANQGRATLRSTLAYLRDGLGAPDAHLSATRDSLAFKIDSDFDLDVQTLRLAARATRELPLMARAGAAPARSPANLRALIATLKDAADRCRGDFLEGFSLSDAPEFDDWASLQRESLHRAATLVFDWLSQLQFESGELAQAIETTAGWVARDRLSEAAHRRMIQVHIAAGDRAGALQAYEACRAVLERELNAEPAPETIALAERIRKDHFRLQIADFRLAPEIPQSQSGALWANLQSAIPLVGRATEHMMLVAAYRSARRGQLQAVAIEGEPGIGKTRLAHEFLAWATAQGADVLQGRAFETGGQLPYQPVVEALRGRLAREADPRQLLGDTWLAELSRLLPELADRLPDLPAPLALSEAEARTRLFEAVARAGQALADRAPLVLFVDDLQWADAATLDLLSYVGRRWAAGTPALLLFTARSEELESAGGSRDAPSLADWLASIERDLALAQVTVGPLTHEDTGTLLRAFGFSESSGDQPTEQLSQWLFGETAGHPFFIVQTLKSLAERDLLQHDDSGAWTITAELTTERAERGYSLPAGVRALIHARLARLSPPALTACTVCAVIGDGCDFGLLGSVAGLGEPDCLVGVEELLRRGLLRESGSRYFFAHDKIREVAYAEVGATRRRVLHRRALEALEAAAAPPAALARHALAAELPEPAFRYSLAAGDHALRLFAVRNAIAHYERARELVSLVRHPEGTRSSVAGDNLARTTDNAQGVPEPTTDAQIDHLYLQLGQAYEFINEWEQAQAVYQALLALVRPAGRAESECAALSRLAIVSAQGFFDLATAVRLLHEAQRVAEQSGDRVRLADTEWNLAQINFYLWNIEESLAHGSRALALAREIGHQELIARSLNVIAYNTLMLGQPGEVVARAEEARALFAALGNRAMEADCLSILSIFRIHWGQIQAGMDAARSGIAIGREIENSWGVANCAYNLAHGLLDCGELTEALAVAHDGVAAARAAGHPPTLVFNLLELGHIYRAIFALESARQAHNEARAIAEALHHPLLLEWSAIELCDDCALAEDWDAAHTFAQQALSFRNYARVYPAFMRWHETAALIRGGDAEQAAEDVRRMPGQLVDSPRYDLQHLCAGAVLARWRGAADEAIAHLEAAGALAEQIGLLNERWQIEATLAEMHLTRGDEQRARQAFARAAGIVQTFAGKLADDHLRAGFLTAPPVRRVLEAL
jgi:DNA-binding SARP family transcriptional activator